jgi:hypothetical protein
MIQELDTVVLTHSLPEHGLLEGEIQERWFTFMTTVPHLKWNSLRAKAKRSPC